MLVGISGKKQSGKNTVAKIWQLLSIYHKCSETSPMRQKYPVDIWWIQHVIDSDINNSSEWKQKSYAHKLKQIVCLLIGCTMEQLEDNDFKESQLDDHWTKYRVWNKVGFLQYFSTKEEAEKKFNSFAIGNAFIGEQVLTPRLLLQLLGTQCGREILHPQIWVNALFADYKLSFNEESQSNPYDPRSKTGGLEYPNWLVTDCRFPNEVSVILDKEGIAIRVDRGNLKTSAKWQEVFKDVLVLDPDGWDRKNYEYSWGEELISPEEYYNRVSQSTCKFSNGVASYLDEYFTLKKDTHISETALDDYESFDYYIKNNGSIESLIKKVKDIMIEEGVIEGILR